MPELVDRRIHLRLQRIVHTIRWQRGAAEVEGFHLGQPFQATAPCAIVALPLGVLQLPPGTPGAVRFEPALDDKETPLSRLAAGSVLKVVLRFPSAFWELLDGGRYRDASFFHASGTSFPTVWTALPLRAPLLTVWAGGPRAERLSAAPLETVVGEAMASVASLFGGRVDVESLVEAAYVHDWQADPFARGAYSYELVGGEQARRMLAAPVEDTLFFAGEATDTEGEAGTVTGALQSGVRAAREVLCR